ncbi:hypothetical protein [Methanococcoides methylutens]|uniref:hypothetical protein n=1 Tax=Methanococcoides methylutens TaxID=2226 RepID=UPI0013623F66|nr:hypothetical protein [Methanococcoides methylutens]
MKKKSYTIQEDKATGRNTITIPSMIMSLKGWKKGTKLEFKENMGTIYLEEVKD